MAVTSAILVPHPPLIISGVTDTDTSDLDSTRRSYLKACQTILDGKPDTIIICTPHNIQYREYFHISPGSHASGSMAEFNVPDVRVDVDYDEEFVAALCQMANEQDLPVSTAGEKDAALDHATVIPLYFLEQVAGGPVPAKIVRLSPSGLSLLDHYRLGQMITQTADKLGRKVAFIASGDLSHVLQEYGPYGFDAVGPGYDRIMIDVLEHGQFNELFSFTEEMRARARECGHRPIVILTGCLDGRDVAIQALSYHDMLGIGYCVCQFVPGAENKTRHFYEEYKKLLREALRKRREKEDEYVSLARRAITGYVVYGTHMSLPESLPMALTKKQNGVFISLYKMDLLRGYAGTYYPFCACTGEEIISNAIAAACENPDYSPVTEDELDDLVINVDVLSEPEIVSSLSKLDSKKYGIIVSSGDRQGLMLPDMEGVDTVAMQVSMARYKAGISEDEPVQIQRFTVDRHY